MVDRVSLYRAPTTVVETAAIADWLGDRLDAEIQVRKRFLEVIQDESDVSNEALASAFAEARVRSPHDRDTGNTMLGIRRYEERVLEDPERGGGVLYDGLSLQQALNGYLPPGELGLDHAHVVLLDRAIGTWGEHDGRWHKRVCVLGQPALISVPGLYEAPAKPEEYYEAKQRSALLAGDVPPREVLEQEVAGEFLIEDDPRTTTALKGYVLQAIHLLDTGEGFCDVDHCRLANPHRQPALITAQLREPAFCEEHADRYG